MERPRASSITIVVNPDEGYNATYQLVKKALNGDTDNHVVSALNNVLTLNRSGVIYPDLQERRAAFPALAEATTTESRDTLIRYIIHELVDSKKRDELEQASQKRQKYIVAIIGAITTLVTSASATIATYYATR